MVAKLKCDNCGETKKNMAYKKSDYTVYEIDGDTKVRACYQRTNYGFRHLAEVYQPGAGTIATGKKTYSNRTWESYNFETAINKAIDNVIHY